MKATSKAPGTKRLNLQYYELLPILLQFWFQFQVAALHSGGGAAAGPEGGEVPAAVRGVPGTAVQVEPMKPMLKAPGTKQLNLKYDELLSSFAFNSKLRRYSLVLDSENEAPELPPLDDREWDVLRSSPAFQPDAGTPPPEVRPDR